MECTSGKLIRWSADTRRPNLRHKLTNAIPIRRASVIVVALDDVQEIIPEDV